MIPTQTGRLQKLRYAGPWKAPAFTDLTFTIALIQGYFASLRRVQNTLPQAASCLSSTERVSISKGIETAVVTAKGSISQEL